jgi:hypothetical protein
LSATAGSRPGCRAFFHVACTRPPRDVRPSCPFRKFYPAGIRLARLWFEVTRHPTAEWLARQITEAFPWTTAPTYLVRDNDRAYGHVFTYRLTAMGIRDPTDLAWIAMAKSVCGASDWHRASRVPGPDADLWRGPPEASSFVVRNVLQRGPHAPSPGQRHARGPHCAEVRQHHRHPDPVRIASPLRADMIFGKDTSRII